MNETAAARAAAGISALSLALLGVSHYALIWGFVGALAALYQHRERLGPLRAICFVVLSTLSVAAGASLLIGGPPCGNGKTCYVAGITATAGSVYITPVA